ncbi:MAG: hypothetical protein HKN21_11020 [Candidatus Eisenbacteria bacterium]|uniref:Tetratricopeptide repeat protein n=1 Tax=Eiseniibacteriota bacterium TaxID=2212470 RepID=A0A7Y2H2R2_UNCEI|nr:hypothetical protein [Candidatus Eisenbacteria bacterium]
MNDLEGLKDYQQWRARKLYDKLRSNPQDVNALVQLAELWSFGENFDRSLEYAKLAMILDPDSRNARIVYAEVLIQSGRFNPTEGYLEILDKELSPCNLGWAFLERRDPASAIRVAEEAIASELQPTACFYCLWSKGLELQANDFIRRKQFSEGLALYELAAQKAKLAVAQRDLVEDELEDWNIYGEKQATRIEQLIERSLALSKKKD